MDAPGTNVRLQTKPGVVLALVLGTSVAWSSSACSQKQELRTGQMVTVRGVIDSYLKKRLVSVSRDAARDGVQVLVFDFQATGGEFGPCYELARALIQLGGSVSKTVAYVSKPVMGHAVLSVLACDEIVMGPEGKLGDPLFNDAGGLTPTVANAYEEICRAKAHDATIVAGMLDKKLRLWEVRTVNGKSILPDDKLAKFEATARVQEKKVIKEAGAPFVLDLENSQKLGLITRSVRSREEVAVAFNLPEKVAFEDVLLRELDRPVLIKLDGYINHRLFEYVKRRLKQARDKESNLLFVEINSTSGDVDAAIAIANALQQWSTETTKTVAWIPVQAQGPAIIIPFGCNEIVVGDDAMLMGVVVSDPRRRNAEKRAARPEEHKETYEQYELTVTNLAQKGRFPLAFAQAFVNPLVAVYEVKSKENPGLRSYKTLVELGKPEVAAVWEKARPGPIKEANVVFSLDGKKALDVDLAVASANTVEELGSVYGVQGAIQSLPPGWIDAMVDALTSITGTVFLITLGMLFLYLELQAPGIGVGGVVAAICFALFFWSRFLSDQANSLEIVLFLLGLALLAIELFLTPGFAVPGFVGLILIISSLVLASQSFVFPTSEAERALFTQNLIKVFSAISVFIGAAIALGRYLPRTPLLRRLILNPPETEVVFEELPATGEVNPYASLLGERGLAMTPLRPAGKMQLGDRFYDVVAQGEFVPPGVPVEVVEVYQNRIVVRRA